MKKKNPEELIDRIIDKLKTCYDPEIPVNIFDLGLIYDIDLSEDGEVFIDMTLTSPGCPVAGSLPKQVEFVVRQLEGVSKAKVNVVWDPPWSPDLMSDEARLELGML